MFLFGMIVGAVAVGAIWYLSKFGFKIPSL
jgi:hypothetical protein